MRARRDAGQMLPLFALVLFVVCGAILVLAHLGQAANRRAQARTAADAAALAGAAAGEPTAARVAAANHARLDDFAIDGDDVRVDVDVAGVHATARARRDPPGPAVTRADQCRFLRQVDPVHSVLCPSTRRG